MVLVLRTCGAYHPHHMCKAPAPNRWNINTQPTRFVIEPNFVNIQEHLFFSILSSITFINSFYNLVPVRAKFY